MMSRFKTWLRKSGIKYSLARGYAFQGQEMIDSLNPLDAAIEHPDYPMARIYRENFWVGVGDTYHVLMGNHYDMYLTGSGRKGILDLLIFPVISRRLVGFSFANSGRYPVLCFFAKAIGYILEIPRGLLGISLTLILTPIIGIVHACAYFEKKNLEKKLRRLKIAKAEPVKKQRITKGEQPNFASLLNDDSTLPLFLLEARGSIQLVNKKQIKENTDREGAESAAQEDKEEDVPLEKVEVESMAAAAQESKEADVALDDPMSYWLTITRQPFYSRRFFAEINERNSDAIGALLGTNTSGILNTLKPEELQKLQQWVKNPP